ncbi:uncharacterized protein COLE_02717 [Cutaneotrichosporon oleaginosum]|uniref:uncharacterized protein n=1 Tax=Cutaneotrichosporon oleaginosum TaxID=879819 RepID=UPI001320584A|nr:hypothetical protein COLE_02717 [Cutaneotrichosporon oleaginosum]
MRPSIEFAEPRTPPATHRSPRAADYVPPRRPHTEFGVPGSAGGSIAGGSGSGNEPRPILRHQSSNVRISSPLRKQVGFEDKPRRPALKSSTSSGSVGASASASASASAADRSPKLSLRERRGRARAQVSWAQTIAVPGEFEELATARPANPRSITSSDGSSRYTSSMYSTDERPALRASRSLSARARPGNRPTSAASSTSIGPAGLWFDVPAPAAPHPSTCMPGFPSQEFPDHRPPKFSRELLRRPGVIMPKAAPRPASIATDHAPRPTPRPQPQPQPQPQPLPQRQPSTSRVAGFLSRKLSKRAVSVSGPAPDVPPLPLPIPRGAAPSMPITPVQHGHQRSQTSTHMPPGFAPPHHPQWPPQSMPARFRGTALPAGAGHFLPPGAAPLPASRMAVPSLPPGAMPMASSLPPGAMPARGVPPLQPQPMQPHVLSSQEAARQALRHYRSSPALMRVASPPLPTTWVERTPPPMPGQLGYDEDMGVRQPDFAHPPVQDTPKDVRPPHLSVDFGGAGDLWADLESSFGALSLPDLPADAESPSSPGSDASHTTTATTRATHTTHVARDAYSESGTCSETGTFSEAGHSLRAASSDVGHAAPLRRGTASDIGHSTAPLVTGMQRDVFSDAGHGLERIYSPPGSPVLAKAAQRAASESEFPLASWSPGHKLCASAPGTPVFLPPRGESLVASSLGATSSRPFGLLHTPPRRTSSRSPSSMSLRSSTSLASESTVSSLPSTMTSMTSASSAASVEMPDPIAEDIELEYVFGIVPKGFCDERAEIRRVQRARSTAATLRVRSVA